MSSLSSVIASDEVPNPGVCGVCGLNKCLRGAKLTGVAIGSFIYTPVSVIEMYIDLGYGSPNLLQDVPRASLNVNCDRFQWGDSER